MDPCFISLSIFILSSFLGCRALTSLLLSSATKTGFGCISWLMATTVTVDSAHIIKVRRVKSDYLHGDDYYMHACTHTRTHMEIQYMHSVFISEKWNRMYSVCISLPLITAIFKVLIWPLLPFFFLAFLCLCFSLTVGPHHPSLRFPLITFVDSKRLAFSLLHFLSLSQSYCLSLTLPCIACSFLFFPLLGNYSR